MIGERKFSCFSMRLLNFSSKAVLTFLTWPAGIAVSWEMVSINSLKFMTRISPSERGEDRATDVPSSMEAAPACDCTAFGVAMGVVLEAFAGADAIRSLNKEESKESMG